MTATHAQPTDATAPRSRRCRFCTSELTVTFVDLGMSPLCERYLDLRQLSEMEPFYPLHVYVCGDCHLVQVEQFVSQEEIFGEYAYFSSFSDTWLEHARVYTEMTINRFGLTDQSLVVELASNDGYLLQYFVHAGIPVLGVEPAANVAKTAVEKGVPTLVEFIGRETARGLAAGGKMADLIAANNVLAQVPDINDFVSGIKLLLKPDGMVTLEFPHLMRLVEGNQLDTIYHEHFSYFSLLTVERIFAAHEMRVVDVEELTTHGGSIRVFVQHRSGGEDSISGRVSELRRREVAAGYEEHEVYASFSERAKETKRKLLEFLIAAKREGKSVAGYGAPGKGNTLLNYCGIRSDFIDYTVDRNPYKQGKFLPGTHIPIFHPDRIKETRPDVVFILPWNLKDEIMEQLSYVRDWGASFMVPIPEVRLYS